MTRVFGRKLVDLATGDVRLTLVDSSDRVIHDERTAVLLRGGTRLAAVSLEKARPLWDAILFAPSRQITLDGEEVLVASAAALESFDAATGARRELFRPEGVTIDSFVAHGATIAVRVSNGEVAVLDRAGSVRVRIPPTAGDRLPNGVDRIVEGDGSAVAVILEEMERVHLARGVAADGTVLWRTSIEHSEMLSQDLSSGVYFFLHFECRAKHHLLFTSHWSTFRHPASVVVRLRDGERVAEIDRHTSALVESADTRLEGLLTVDTVRSELCLFEPGAKLTQRWAARAPSATHRRADVAWTPRGLLVAQYDAIASGARLLLLDTATGALIWQAEVEDRLPFERTPLFLNGWSITVEGDRVVLLGDESVGSTAQVFDLASGRRVYSDLHV